MKQLLQVTIAILFLYQGIASAASSMGGEITYRHIDGLRYEVSIKYYRDCRSIPLGTPGAEMYAGGTLKKSLSLTRVSIKDVTNYCKTAGSQCYPPNTTAGLGIEEHIFLDTVDFNNEDSAFKKYCTVSFGVGSCCRNNAIGTGAAGQNYWVTSFLNFCIAPNNSSPQLTSTPINILCCNQPWFYNEGAMDSINHDSLSYSLADPLQSWSFKTSWIGGYSSSKPFSDYWPSGYDKNKGPNPNVNPPIGTFFDRETGDLILTPSDCSESTIMAIKVTEWRKDSTGKYKIIGEVTRDMQYWVNTCTDNNPPLLYGPYKRDVCAGDKLCFNITSDDKQFIPPPPGKPNPPDTVSLTWNNGIGKGATFKIIDSSARLQKGQFCWTPKESDASDIPYSFAVTARDNACPRNAVSVKSYSVKVKKRAKATFTKTFIKNGLYELKAEIAKDFKGSPSYMWEIMDSTMNPVSSHYFHLSGGLVSNKQLDSVQFLKGGNYILHRRINNSPLNCPTDYFDTFKVAPVTPILLMEPSGIQEMWVCKNTVDTMFTSLKNERNPVRYRWSSSSADTLPYLIKKITQNSTYRVDVYDSAGYHRFAEWQYFIYDEPILLQGKDVLACVGDSVLLKTVATNFTDTVFWKWFYEGKLISTNPQIKVVEPGRYSLEIYDSNQCVSKVDTIEVKNMKVNVDAGVDLVACLYDTITFNAIGLDTSDAKTGSYKWYIQNLSGTPFKSTQTFQYPLDSNGRMIVLLSQVKGTLVCTDLDTVNFTYHPLPEIELSDGKICQNEIELDLHSLILKPVNSHKGIVNWQLTKTLKKPNGNDNTVNDLVIDKDNTSNDLYYLKADDSNIDLNGKFIDSLKLSLTYKDANGCVSTSSNDMTITVRSNVEVTFINKEIKRCYGDSVKYISNDYGVNYYGGKWFTMNDSSNYLKWPQGNIVQLSEKLGTKTLDAKGGKYVLKYVLENNQCLSYKNAILNIIPFPAIVWTQVYRGDSIVLADKTNAERREWYINSKKISETNTLVVSKTDAKQVKIELKAFNTSCETDSIIKPDVIGINDLHKEGFSISPNPVRNELLIKTSLNKAYSIEIINSLGQVLMVKSTNQSHETIDVSGIPAGIYTIILKTGNDILMQKFLKTSD